MSSTITITRKRLQPAAQKQQQYLPAQQQQQQPAPFVYPESEEQRAAAFCYLYELEKKTGAPAWDLMPAFTVHMDKSKPIAELYIMEYLTQTENILATYIPLKDQVYGPLHYKTLSAQLIKFYKDYPPY